MKGGGMVRFLCSIYFLFLFLFQISSLVGRTILIVVSDNQVVTGVKAVRVDNLLLEKLLRSSGTRIKNCFEVNEKLALDDHEQFPREEKSAHETFFYHTCEKHFELCAPAYSVMVAADLLIFLLNSFLNEDGKMPTVSLVGIGNGAAIVKNFLLKYAPRIDAVRKLLNKITTVGRELRKELAEMVDQMTLWRKELLSDLQFYQSFAAFGIEDRHSDLGIKILSFRKALKKSLKKATFLLGRSKIKIFGKTENGSTLLRFVQLFPSLSNKKELCLYIDSIERAGSEFFEAGLLVVNLPVEEIFGKKSFGNWMRQRFFNRRMRFPRGVCNCC
jgi:hypothetical protein